MICLACGGAMREARGPVTELYRGREYTVENVTRRVCESCGECEIDADEADRLTHEIGLMYRRDEGLLSPGEIRSIRERLMLKQKDFESLLGVSTPTVSRWETGAMLQSKTADRLMRVLAAHPEIAHELVDPSIGAG